MKDIVTLLTCFAIVYHYTVGDCFHAHCQTPVTPAKVATPDHPGCPSHGERHHDGDAHEGHAHDGASHSTPDVPAFPSCPHDDFHETHGAATLVAGSPYSHWGAAKAPLAVLDGLIVVACEQLGSCEPFCRELAHDYHARTRGDCYRGLGAFLS